MMLCVMHRSVNDTLIIILALQRGKQREANVYTTYLCHMCMIWLNSVLSHRPHCNNIPTPCPAMVHMPFSMYTELCRSLRLSHSQDVTDDGNQRVYFTFPARLSSCLSLLANPATAAVSIIPVTASTGAKLRIRRVISHPCMKEMRIDSTMLVTSCVMIPTREVACKSRCF